MRVSCLKSDMSSGWSASTEPVRTPPLPAATPLIASPTPLANDSILLTWNLPSNGIGDCDFASWDLLGRQLSSQDWTSVEGCRNLTSKCTTTCTAVGLDADTHYVFKVWPSCNHVDADGPFSEETFPVATKPRKAGVPSEVAVVVVGPTEILLGWRQPSLGQCASPRYRALAKIGDSDWFHPSGCNNNGGGSSNCTITELSCDTSYTFKVGVECENEYANSDYSAEVSAVTPRGDGPCSRPASPPRIVATTAVGPSVVYVNWTEVDLGDCLPLGVAIYVRSMADPTWRAYPECWPSTAQTSCRVQGLRSNEGYSFKLRQ
ncbi:hypothetical protein FOZ63_031223, partial [Perkinsus olseni]